MNKKRFAATVFLSLLLVPFLKANPITIPEAQNQIHSSESFFEENKGQFIDEKGNPLTDVLFKTRSNGVEIYITKKGITYLFLKEEEQSSEDPDNLIPKGIKSAKAFRNFNYCRVEMILEGASIKKENASAQNQVGDVFCNYYLSANIQVMNVKRHQKILVKNVYPGIDWILYSQGEKGLEYDFIVNPGADAGLIKMKYEGLESISQNRDGSYTISNSLGQLNEGTPKSFYECDSKEVKTSYLIGHKEIKFDIEKYDHTKTLVIDPPVVWSTFFGGSSMDDGFAVTTDPGSNMYLTGYVFSANIPLKNPGGGAYYQGVLKSPSNAVITKFDKNGVIRWSTIYGTACHGYAICADMIGNIYLTGDAQYDPIPFPTKDPGVGSYYQSVVAGSTTTPTYDIYIAKFDTSGVLKWATLYGGNTHDSGMGIATDAANDVYVTAKSASLNTPLFDHGNGAYYQTTGSGATIPFFIKYSSAGERKWATYCGSSNMDLAAALCSDPTGTKIYGTGVTTSLAAFPTKNVPGAYNKNSYTGSGANAYLVEFDTTCKMQWSTYVGGNNSSDWGYSVATDKAGNVFLALMCTTKDFPLQSSGPGSYLQTTNTNSSPGAPGACFVEFDVNRKMVWSTYYGGSLDETAFAVTTDISGNVYFAGMTTSPDLPLKNVPANNLNQSTLGTTSGNGFIVQFDNSNKLVWASYYGGSKYEHIWALWGDKKNGCVYGTGLGSSPSGLFIKNLAGAYNQAAPKGNSNMFILKMCPSFLAKDTTVPPLCSADSNGTSTVTPVGGTSPFTYSWNNGQTTATATGLAPGSYTVVTTDASGQSTNNIILVTPPPSLNITATSTAASCGASNGTATIIKTAGTSGYTYSWKVKTPSGQLTPTGSGASEDAYTGTFGGFAQGTYTLIVTDSKGCSSTSTFSINNTGLKDSVSSITAASCFGSSNGTATVGVAGTATPFTYSWSNAGGQTSANATGLTPGTTYTVTIKDANNCVGTITVSVTSPGAIKPTVSSTATQCTGSTGTATVSSTGGKTPYVYSWSAGGQTTTTATGLSSGTFTVTVTDSALCKQTDTVIVAQASNLNFTEIHVNASCNGQNDGSVTLTPSGGTSPYNYTWNPPAQTGSAVTGLAAATYSVEISDANGCTKTATVKVTQPPAINSGTASTHATSNNGTASVSVSGGASPYTFSWSPTGAGTPTISNLPAGTYTVKITDAKGCTKLDSVIVLAEIPCSDPFFPTAFSPNNDGVNEIFIPHGPCLKQKLLQVYDRWGEKIFETTDPNTGWDGMYNGKIENTGVYIYYFEGTNTKTGDGISKKGNVTLVR